MKRSAETEEQREVRLRKNREQYHKKKEDRVLRNEHLNQQQDESLIQDNECRLPESDRNLLKNFHIKIDKLANNHCPVCNEQFPSIDLVQEVCRRCYSDKNPLKRFSAANNMDLGEVLVEL